MSVKGVLRPGSVRDKALRHIEHAGAVTIRDIAAALGVSQGQAHSALGYLMGAQYIHIACWGISPSGRTIPVYKPGAGANAKRPAPIPPSVVKRASRASRNWGATPAAIDKTLAFLQNAERRHYQALIRENQAQVEKLQEQARDLQARETRVLYELEQAATRAKGALRARVVPRVGEEAVLFGTCIAPLSLLDQLQRAGL